MKTRIHTHSQWKALRVSLSLLFMLYGTAAIDQLDLHFTTPRVINIAPSGLDSYYVFHVPLCEQVINAYKGYVFEVEGNYPFGPWSRQSGIGAEMVIATDPELQSVITSNRDTFVGKLAFVYSGQVALYVGVRTWKAVSVLLTLTASFKAPDASTYKLFTNKTESPVDRAYVDKTPIDFIQFFTGQVSVVTSQYTPQVFRFFACPLVNQATIPIRVAVRGNQLTDGFGTYMCYDEPLRECTVPDSQVSDASGASVNVFTHAAPNGINSYILMVYGWGKYFTENLGTLVVQINSDATPL